MCAPTEGMVILAWVLALAVFVVGIVALFRTR